MKNELTLETAASLSNEELLAALANALSDAVDGVARACVAVAVLRERGHPLPTDLLPEVYRYAKEVAEGVLSPRAALTLARFPFMVKAIQHLPHDLQERLAGGEKVKIAVKVNGRIQSAERTILEMSPMQMRLAFADGKITPWEEQGAWLLKSGHEEPSATRKQPVPRFDVKSGLIVARGSYKVEDFMQALGAAGYQIVPIYKGNRLARPKPVVVGSQKGS